MLRPIIFSHGVGVSPSDYSGLFSDLASRGYIVFAVFHQDGTCSYTEDAKENAIPFSLPRNKRYDSDDMLVRAN
jgi:hypothetical protein